MQKGRIMEITGNSKNCDSALPPEFIEAANRLGLQPHMWYVWTYQEAGIFGKPVNLAESFFLMLDETKITIENGCEVSILDLVETLLAHPEEVSIRVR